MLLKKGVINACAKVGNITKEYPQITPIALTFTPTASKKSTIKPDKVELITLIII